MNNIPKLKFKYLTLEETSDILSWTLKDTDNITVPFKIKAWTVQKKDWEFIIDNTYANPQNALLYAIVYSVEFKTAWNEVFNLTFWIAKSFNKYQLAVYIYFYY